MNFHSLMLTVFLTIASTLAPAQTFPSKPVRLVVGAPAGTSPDIVARILAQRLSEAWGHQRVIVDNKPGAGGLIGAGEVARASPDGYTLLLVEPGTLCIAPHIYRKLPYSPTRDFTPVSQVTTGNEFVLLVDPQKTPAQNFGDFVTWARQQEVFLATFGAGTPGHFGAHMLGTAINAKVQAVHFRNAGEILGALRNGDVHATFGSMTFSLPQVRSGKLLALASTGGTRSALLPNTPTFSEQGYAGMAFGAWFGIVVPSRTPADIVGRLNAHLAQVLQAPEVRKSLEKAGFTPAGTSSQAFAKVIAADTVSWGKAVAGTGFKAD